jgi:hypothetical protein
MKTTVAAGLFLCAACMIDREIGSRIDPRPLGSAPGPATPPPVRLAPPPLKTGPCCTALPQVGLDDPHNQAGAPKIAWDGAGWAVTWRDGRMVTGQDFDRNRPVLRMMAGDTPGASLVIDPGQPDTTPTAIAHRALSDGSARYLLALEPSVWLRWPDQDPHTRLLLVDAAGTKQALRDIEPSGRGGAVAWAAGLAAWAFVSFPEEAEDEPPSRLFLLDETTLAPIGASIALGVALPDGSFPISVLSLNDRVISVVPSDDGVHIRTFVGRTLAEPNPELILDADSVIDSDPPEPGLPRDPDAPVDLTASVAAALVGDRVVIAAMDGVKVHTWSYDPATGKLVAGPNVVGTSRHVGRLSMGGDSLGSTAGLCFSVGDGPGDPDGLQFALVGPDGVPRGEPITLAQGLRYVATCDVAAGGPDEYLVALWNAAGRTQRHSILARRVRVQREQKID